MSNTHTTPTFSAGPLVAVAALICLTHAVCTALIIHNAWQIARHVERSAPTLQTVQVRLSAVDMITLTDALDSIGRSIRTAPPPLPGVPPELIPDIIAAIPRSPSEIAVQTEAPRTELQIMFPDSTQWCAPSPHISVSAGAARTNAVNCDAEHINHHRAED